MPEEFINVPLKISDLVSQLDPDHMGSDGTVNGQPAFQWDFSVNGEKYQVFFLNK